MKPRQDGYYTDGQYLYEVVTIGFGLAGPIILRDVLSEDLYTLLFGDFRQHHWLVAVRT